MSDGPRRTADGDEPSRTIHEDDDPDGGLRFHLPPIRLPPFFPDDLRLRLPVPSYVRGSGNVLLAAIALDVIDAAVVLTVGGGPARVALGTLLAVVLAGPLGLAYAVEAVALVASAWLGVVPTATLLVVLRGRGLR